MTTIKYYDQTTSTWKYLMQGPKGDTGPQGPAGPAGSGSGDMLVATYDPTAKHADAFSQDNMVDGTTNKNYSAADKLRLANTSGTNTGDQTNITGNAGTATKLATSRNINGVGFDGTGNITIVDSTKVPTSTTVNGHALSSNVTVTADDVLPTQTGNSGKFLSTNGTTSSWGTITGGGDMLLGTTQTVTATKTFNAGKLLDKGEIVFDVKAYGAVGNDSTDDTAAIQAAVDAAWAAGGGEVLLPAGTFKTTAAIKLYSGTSPTITAYSNISIRGAGASGVNGSIIKQYTTGVDAIKALNDPANGAQSVGIKLQDFAVSFGGTATNSGNGIYAAQQATSAPAFYQWTIRNVRANSFQGTGKYGFNIESMIVSTIEGNHAFNCANGFFLNGSALSHYGSVSTSVTMNNNYANACLGYGYRLVNATYLTLVACAADISTNVTTAAYSIEGCNSVSLTACGFELDGTHTLTNGFSIAADASSVASQQVTLNACYGFQSKTCTEVNVSSGQGITVVGYQSNSSVSGSTGLKVASGSTGTDINCAFDTGTATPRNINGTALWNTIGDSDSYGTINAFTGLTVNGIAVPTVSSADTLSNKRVTPRINSVASSATPSINTNTTDQFDITALAVAITSMTTNLTGTPTDGQSLTIRIKDNGVGRGITWGTGFASSGTATLLSTTVASKTHLMRFVYDSVTTKWVCVFVDATGY